MSKRRIGIVGLGFGAHLIDRSIVSGPGAPFFELGAVCDMHAAKADEFGRKYGVRAYHSLDALLADADIPVIGLFTGPNGRAGLLRKIIRAGRDVMTTKPFEVDPVAAADVLREAAESKRVLHLNSPCASLSDDWRQIMEWQRSYSLGRPLAARHEALYKRLQQADGSWYDDPALCPVAPVMRLGVYGLNDMVRLFGEADTIQVTQSRLFTGRPTPDLAMAMIRFKNGAIGETLDSWCLHPPRGDISLTVHFESGSVHREIVESAAHGGQPMVRLRIIPGDRRDGEPVETVLLDRQQASDAYQWDVFHRALDGEPVPDATPHALIVGAVKIIAAMARAGVSGRAEPV